MSPEQNPDLAKIMNGHTFFNSEDPDIFISLFKMEQILLNPREAFSKALNTLLSNKYTLCEADNFTGIKDPDNYRFRMNESIGYLSNFGEASESYAYTNNNDLVSAYLVGCTMLTLKPTNNF